MTRTGDRKSTKTLKRFFNIFLSFITVLTIASTGFYFSQTNEEAAVFLVTTDQDTGLVRLP